MVCVMCDDSPVRGQSATQSGQYLRSHLNAVSAERMFQAAKKRAFLALMFGDEFPHLVDGVNAAEVAVALRHAPGKQPVATQQNSVDTRIFAHRFFDQQS